MRQLTKFLALALAALALAAAGCGGDDEEPTVETGVSGATGASGTPLTQAQFVETADELCAEGAAELEQEPQPTTAAELEPYVSDVLVPSIQEQLDAIGALTPPEGEEEQVQEFLDTAQEELDAVEADPASLSEQSFEETEVLADEVGLAECGTG